MTTITLPTGTATHTDLVAVPRRNYEDFLLWQKTIKSAKTFEPTPKEKKELAQARKNFAAGKSLTIDELGHALGIEH